MWEKYRKKGISEMRPYEHGEDLTGISVAAVDQPTITGGMIARNPVNPEDQWFVAQEYFDANYDKEAL